MEFVAKKGEVILMDENDTYLVLKTIEHDGAGYLHLIKTGDHLLDMTYEADLKQEFFAKEVFTEDDNYFLEFVTDENLIETLKNN